MTAGEIIKILQVLDEDQFVGFEIKSLQKLSDVLKKNMENKAESTILHITSYEHTDIGEGDDEMFYFNFEPIIV